MLAIEPGEVVVQGERALLIDQIDGRETHASEAPKRVHQFELGTRGHRALAEIDHQNAEGTLGAVALAAVRAQRDVDAHAPVVAVGEASAPRRPRTAPRPRPRAGRARPPRRSTRSSAGGSRCRGTPGSPLRPGPAPGRARAATARGCRDRAPRTARGRPRAAWDSVRAWRAGARAPRRWRAPRWPARCAAGSDAAPRAAPPTATATPPRRGDGEGQERAAGQERERGGGGAEAGENDAHRARRCRSRRRAGRGQGQARIHEPAERARGRCPRWRCTKLVVAGGAGTGIW